MSAVADLEHGGTSGTRSLALAVSAVLALLLLTGLVIGFAGSAEDGDPRAQLDLLPTGERSPALEAIPPGQAGRSVNGHLVSRLALIEDSPDGPLPRIGQDGATPMAAYAVPFDAKDRRPRIAVVVTGLGVSETATAQALAQLPASVTVSFVPFTPQLQLHVDQARGRGREVLLEVPMEPFDFPDSDPGPHALMVAAESAENIQRLNWTLSRATGYVGVANLLGGRFLGETGAIEPVLGAVAKRGLLFFDNGQNANSVALTAARHVQAPLAVSNLSLDSVQTALAIDTQLAQLEAEARQHGFAVATAGVYPITIDRLVAWASHLDERNLVLVPLTAVVTPPQSTR
jgi:polysaccharide deacetylase 2 family uncharacterized protein YibQ